MLSVAAKLAKAQETASSLPSAGSAKDALKGAKGALGGLAKKVTGRGKSAKPAIPADGTRCQDCGTAFGMFNRRFTCGSCERFLCAECCGQGGIVAITGIRCFADSSCAQCRDQDSQFGEFKSVRKTMESGLPVTVGLPVKGGVASFFGAGDNRRQVPAFLRLDSEQRSLVWSSLEQRDGRPAEEGSIPVHEVLYARDTGAFLEIAIVGQKEPALVTFAEPGDRADWAAHVELAVKVLTPDGERAALDAARATHRRAEMEERRAVNEERRKKLSEGLGMKFTAEAMLTRGG